MSKETRPSPIAGYWYSDQPVYLKNELLQYLDSATLPVIKGKVVGIYVPHAGYRYSGQTAAYAFKTVRQKQFDQVVILSPLHAYHPANIITSAHNYYETPLGKVPVDQLALQKLDLELGRNKFDRLTAISNDREHSLEIELPFLQTVLSGNFLLLPLMIRQLNPDQSIKLAEYLFKGIKPEKTLIVASTDLSHFYPQSVAEKLDSEMLRQIENYSIDGVYETENQEKGFACGLSALMVAMALCRLMGATQAQKLHYTTSAEMTADSSSVVGYGSGVFLKSDDQILK